MNTGFVLAIAMANFSYTPFDFMPILRSGIFTDYQKNWYLMVGDLLVKTMSI